MDVPFCQVRSGRTGKPERNLTPPPYFSLHLPKRRRGRKAPWGPRPFTGLRACSRFIGVESFEPFGELEGEELAEKFADADAGVIIAVASGIVFFRFIVSMNRTVKGQFHETRKG